jgi:hypothetical protein
MKRTLDIFGMLLIGDGLLAVLNPTRHCHFWEVGPESCRKLADEFAEHPPIARAAGVLEILVGLWLACEQEDHRSLFDRLHL